MSERIKSPPLAVAGRVIGAMAIASGGLAAALFVLAPTRQAQAFFTETAPFLARSPLLWVFLLAAACFFGGRLAGTLAAWSEAPAGNGDVGNPVFRSVARLDPAVLSFCLLVSGIVLARSIVQIDSTPMNWDEQSYASLLVAGQYRETLTPSTMGNHLLPAWMSAISVKALGAGKVPLRLPAVLFTALFLAALAFLARRLPRLAAILLLAHVAASGLVEWYAHSFRGYIALVACSTWLYALLFAFCRGERVGKRPALWFFLAAAATPLAHGMGFLFAGACAGAFVLWLSAHRDELTGERRTEALKFLGALGLVLVAFSPLAIKMMQESMHWRLPSPGPSALSGTLAQLFGLSRDWWGRVVALLLALVVVMRGSDSPRDFMRSSALVLLLLVGGFLCLTDNFNFPRRFLMAYLVPLVVALGAAASQLKGRTGALVTAALLLALVAAPAVTRDEVAQSESSGLGDHDAFVRQARRLAPPGRAHCYSFEGDPHLVAFTHRLHLPGSRLSGEPGCERHFHLTLHWPHATERRVLGRVPEGRRETLFTDGASVLEEILPSLREPLAAAH